MLSVRLGVIGRVMYNLGEWAKVPRRLATGGRTVRLDGYHRQPVNTIEVVGLDNARIALLVVAPQTEPDQAHATTTAAAGVDDASTVDGLLVVGAAG